MNLQDRSFKDHENTHNKLLQRQLDEMTKKNLELTKKFTEDQREVKDMMQHFMEDIDEKSINSKQDTLTAMLTSYTLQMKEKEKALLASMDDKIGNSVSTLRDLEASTTARIRLLLDDLKKEE